MGFVFFAVYAYLFVSVTAPATGKLTGFCSTSNILSPTEKSGLRVVMQQLA